MSPPNPGHPARPDRSPAPERPIRRRSRSEPRAVVAPPDRPGRRRGGGCSDRAGPPPDPARQRAGHRGRPSVDRLGGPAVLAPDIDDRPADDDSHHDHDRRRHATGPGVVEPPDASAAQRSGVVAAVAEIGTCGNLNAAQSTLQGAVDERQTLLGQLDELQLPTVPNAGPFPAAAEFRPGGARRAPTTPIPRSGARRDGSPDRLRARRPFGP